MYLINAHTHYRQPLAERDAAPFAADAPAAPLRFLNSLGNYRPTPLRSLPALSAALGLGAIHIKDEGERLGLHSFKALGGMFAVARLVQDEATRKLGRPVDISELQTDAIRDIASGITVACASAGNHGRSVAAGAQMLGAKARIFLYEGVHPSRRAAIEQLGADIVQVAGNYDVAVLAAAAACAEQQWHCISDTAWAGYEAIPGQIMQGYTVLAQEALAQCSETPTHVFIQAGVGGLAAAMAGYLQSRLGADRPRFIVVEPAQAACLMESTRAGQSLSVAVGTPSAMAMLDCCTPSLFAWRVLSHTADVFMAIDDAEATGAMRCLAQSFREDPAIGSSESGSAGMAGLLHACTNLTLRADLGLGPASRVLLVNTEAARPQ